MNGVSVIGILIAQVFGVQFGNAILQNATHGEERAEHQDSISGGSGSDGRIEGFLRGVKGIGPGVFSGI